MIIKQKKQLNLPQLIEWAWDNGVKGENFPTDQNEEAGIYFATNRDFMMNNADFIRYNNTFTVEVEEVVDEDTVFNYLLLTYKNYNDKIETHYYEDRCIKSVLSQSSRLMYVSEQLSITYFDDKGIPHLIWTNEKGLVE